MQRFRQPSTRSSHSLRHSSPILASMQVSLKDSCLLRTEIPLRIILYSTDRLPLVRRPLSLARTTQNKFRSAFIFVSLPTTVRLQVWVLPRPSWPNRTARWFFSHTLYWEIFPIGSFKLSYCIRILKGWRESYYVLYFPKTLAVCIYAAHS